MDFLWLTIGELFVCVYVSGMWNKRHWLTLHRLYFKSVSKGIEDRRSESTLRRLVESLVTEQVYVQYVLITGHMLTFSLNAWLH